MAVQSCTRQVVQKSSQHWLSLVSPKKLALQRALLKWYRASARDLPWRRDYHPYVILVSEVMLQQTRVETVLDYFSRFLKAFPTVEALAKATEDQVFKQWEGLGYYNRARNLHRAAQVIHHDLRGEFPRTVQALLKLPGIGRYTAGALVSFAYDKPAPILDGNIKRVLARLFAVRRSIDQPSVIDELWQAAEILVSQRNPRAFNQAMMELGARICVPRSPKCNLCPVSKHCESYRLEMQKALPMRDAKKAIPHAHVVAAAILKDGKYLLGKRPTGKLLGGLWEFPGGKVELGESPEAALAREIKEELGMEVEVMEHLITVEHGYTHLTVSIALYRCEPVNGDPQTLYHSEVRWVPRAEFKKYAFPAANHKFFDVLE